MDVENILKNELSNIQTNIPLRDFVSIGVGGVADYFYVAESINDLVKAVMAAYRVNLPFIVLGSGNNVIPGDKGFDGLVIKNESKNIVFSGVNSEVIVDSGVKLSHLVNLAAGRDLGGLEFLESTSDTIGGALHFDLCNEWYKISDYVKSVTALVKRQGDLVVVSQSGYSSLLKRTYTADKDFSPVVLTVKLQLVRRRKDEILRMIKENIQEHNSSKSGADKIFWDVFRDDTGAKLPVQTMLDESGARRMRVGGAMVCPSDSNCIINRKNASANDIMELVSKMKEAVKSKFDYEINERVEYVGRW